MTPKERLIAAKALIDTPAKWVKGSYAADSKTKLFGYHEIVIHLAPPWVV
jgi:hypothetical protein